MVTAAELIELSNQQGDLQGWDFSSLQIEEAPPFRYEEVVVPFLRPDDVVLDLGTGGGEVFLSLSQHFGRGLGVDQSGDRLTGALTKARKDRLHSVDFARMNVTDLALAAESFDAVLAKHADYAPDEVFRVLRPGGVFVTQQMGDRDTSSIFDAFGWGTFGGYWRERFARENRIFRPTAETARRFEALGCNVIDYQEYDVPLYFRDLRSLVFFLRSSPLPEQFEPERHWQPVSRLFEEHTTDLGIQTNTHRQLLIIRKP